VDVDCDNLKGTFGNVDCHNLKGTFGDVDYDNLKVVFVVDYCLPIDEF
jgi:hypothetical protein